MATKSLQQLQDQARFALAHPELIKVAENFSPTAAYNRTLALHYSESIAQSCRFLAIIGRDYGKDAIRQTVVSQKQSRNDKLYNKTIVPGIKTLENLMGAPLMIVGPEDRGLTLTQYLEDAKPCTLELDLQIGEYKIHLKNKVMRRDRDSGYDFAHEVILVSPSGEKLINENSRYSCLENRNDRSEMQRRLYSFLIQSLFSLEPWPHDSALITIRNDLEKRGQKVAPRLWEAFKDQSRSLDSAERYGLVDLISKLGSSLRQKAIDDGVSANFISVLNFEINESLDQASWQERTLDKNIPLADKLRQGMFGTMDYTVIPGPRAEKTYNFLLHTDREMVDWVQLLKDKGYGGSIIIGFYNIDSGMYIAETGQCDAFLLQQHGGRPKDDILCQAQAAMKRARKTFDNSQAPIIPKFEWYPNYADSDWDNQRRTCGGFDRFLDMYFPLN